MTRRTLKTYFILDRSKNLVKIGKTYNLDNRLHSLQTANGTELEAVLVLEHRPPYEEEQLHWRFRNYLVRGEWYFYDAVLQKFVADKTLNSKPTPADDIALAGDEDHPGFEYKEEPDSTAKLTLSPIYGQNPKWRLDSTSQDYWNGFRIKDEA
jgi:Meiotically Up-regulated Gene 113 (MUG113) protein